jgi:fructokinase
MSKNIICFGEMLWDELPSGAIPGGAPMNVAIRLTSFGNKTSIISKIGSDTRGVELIQLLSEKQVNTSFIQEDNQLATGRVTVTLDQFGTATYDIVRPVAWDNISFSDEIASLVPTADYFVFGSLVTRDERSKNTLDKLLPLAKTKVFDVNLRAPFFDVNSVFHYMKQADIIKLNDEELTLLMANNQLSLEEMTLLLAQETKTDIICVTRGANGALLYCANTFYEHPGFQVTVADTIGAGDSFLATFIHLLATTSDYQTIITQACAVGALVASKKGANQTITDEEIKQLINSNQ